MLAADMDRIDAGQSRLDWPACIPQEYQQALEGKSGLEERRGVFLDRYQALSAQDRIRVHGAMSRHNAFPAIFDDGEPCICMSDLPDEMRKATKSLFEFAYGLLIDLGLRDKNYESLYNQLKYKVCAFCGIATLDAPKKRDSSSKRRRESLDHYLPIAKYSFAGSNFRNLSPMCTKCNSLYKLQQDPLTDPATRSRRTCCDPYNSPTISLSLHESRPFEGPFVNLMNLPMWIVQWEGGDPEKLKTWESVFAISERYRESSLNPNFRGWIDHFCQWAAGQPTDISNPESLRGLIRDFADIIVPEGLAESAFLKRATFQMLEARCNDTEEGRRVFDWLREQILERRALNASFKQ